MNVWRKYEPDGFESFAAGYDFVSTNKPTSPFPLFAKGHLGVLSRLVGCLSWVPDDPDDWRGTGHVEPLGPLNAMALTPSRRAVVTSGGTKSAFACSGSANLEVGDRIAVKDVSASPTEYLAYYRQVTEITAGVVTFGGGDLTLEAGDELIAGQYDHTCLGAAIAIDTTASSQPFVCIDDGILVAAAFSTSARNAIVDIDMWPDYTDDTGIHISTEISGRVYNGAAGAGSYAGIGHSYGSGLRLFTGGVYNDAATWKNGIAIALRATPVYFASVACNTPPASGDLRVISMAIEQDDGSAKHYRLWHIFGSWVAEPFIPLEGPNNVQANGTLPNIDGAMCHVRAATSGRIGYKMETILHRITQ